MKIAALKIQQKKLGLSDVRYRDLLLKIGRVSSSKELTPSAAKKVYSAMCQMAEASTPAARYVWVLWTQLQPHLSPKNGTEPISPDGSDVVARSPTCPTKPRQSCTKSLKVSMFSKSKQRHFY